MSRKFQTLSTTSPLIITNADADPNVAQSRSINVEDSWVDPNMFNVFLAVPEAETVKHESIQVFVAVPEVQEVKTDTLRYDEHIYTISKEDLTNTNDDKPSTPIVEGKPPTPIVGRRQFRVCHSTCVQATCLPVSDVSQYSSCVNKCKSSCQT